MTTFYEEIEKKRVMRDDAEDAQSRASVDKWIFRFLLTLIGVMPLLVFGHVEDVISPLISYVDVLSSGVKGELFTHYKALFVVGITIITGAMLLAKIYFMNGSIKKTWLNYVLGVFAIAIIVSTVFSPNITVALNGLYNRSDGAISWLCYIALMFIAMNISYPKNVVNYIMYTLMPFVYINLFLITMNFYGKDLLQNDIVSRIVMSTLPEGSSLGANSQLLGTLNQWNYMSGMFAMMTVMYLAWAVTSKKWHKTIVGAITASVSIAIMFMSISTSGFLTVTVLLPVILICIIRIKNFKNGLVALAAFLIISIPTFNILAEKEPKVWTESFGFFMEKNPYEQPVVANIFKESNTVYASEKTLELPVLPERAMSAGSGRVYIWEKALDLSKDRLLLGYGADSIIYNFPHYSLDARSGMSDENVIVDKPHNQYIGNLYNFGILGFIALITLAFVAFSTMLISILKKSNNTFIFSTIVLAYFIQLMFNDSLPSISAIAFVLLGIMLGLSNKNDKEPLLNGRNN